MPEAASHVDELAETRKHQIGIAWERAHVQAKAKAESVRDAADDQLGRGVLAFDGAQAGGASTIIVGEHESPVVLMSSSSAIAVS